jgi:hypothetical protein
MSLYGVSLETTDLENYLHEGILEAAVIGTKNSLGTNVPKEFGRVYHWVKLVNTVLL